MEILVQVFIGVVVGVLSVVIIEFRSEWKKAEENAQMKRVIQDKALKEILGYFIDNKYEQYMTLGFISTEKLNKVINIFDCYHALGGNGTREMEIAKLKELPNVLTKNN